MRRRQEQKNNFRHSTVERRGIPLTWGLVPAPPVTSCVVTHILGRACPPGSSSRLWVRLWVSFMAYARVAVSESPDQGSDSLSVTKMIIIGTTAAAAAAKSLQSCLILCDLIDSSPPGSPVSGILQARILEWLSISFSNAWKWKMKVKSLGRVRLLVTPCTAALQVPPSMEFSRQEHWSGVPLPSPETTAVGSK